MFRMKRQTFPNNHLLISFGGLQVSRLKQTNHTKQKMQIWFSIKGGFPTEMFCKNGKWANSELSYTSDFRAIPGLSASPCGKRVTPSQAIR